MLVSSVGKKKGIFVMMNMNLEQVSDKIIQSFFSVNCVTEECSRTYDFTYKSSLDVDTQITIGIIKSKNLSVVEFEVNFETDKFIRNTLVKLFGNGKLSSTGYTWNLNNNVKINQINNTISISEPRIQS